jgi:sugar phosphate isomerase/epimerase
MELINRRHFAKNIALTTAALAAGFGTDSAPAQSAAKSYKIVGFTKPFQNLDAEQTADTITEIGWDGIECPVRPQGQIEPERAADELPKMIEALKKHGKELTIVTTSILSATQPGAEKLLRLAANLGIKRYRLGFFSYNPKKTMPGQVQEYIAIFRDLAALNKEIGITGGIQNHSGEYFGAAIWDAWLALKDLDPHYLGNFFDIGHASIEGGLTWRNHARLMQPHFMTVSVKDFVWQKQPKGGAKSEWVPLGEGLLNKDFFKWLKTTPFDGPISHHAEYKLGSGKPMIEQLRKDVEVLRGWVA